MTKEKSGKKSFIHKRIEKIKNGIVGSSYFTVLKRHTFQKVLIALVVGGIVAFILSHDMQIFVQQYDVGDIATIDIKASQDLLVEDVESTLKRKEEVEKELRSIYDYDEEALLQITRKTRTAFGLMRSFHEEREALQKAIEESDDLPAEQKSQKSPVASDVVSTAELPVIPVADPQTLIDETKRKGKEFQDIIGFKLSDDAFNVFEKAGFANSFVETISDLLSPVLKVGVVSNKELLVAEKDKGIIVRGIQTKEEKVVMNLGIFYDVNDAREAIFERSQQLSLNLPEVFSRGIASSRMESILEISQKLLIPNLTFNKSATEEQRVRLLDDAKPVYFQIKKNEIIVREGERVTHEDLLELQASMKAGEEKRMPSITVGIFVLALALFYVFYNFSLRNIRKFSPNPKDLLLLGLVLISILLLVRVGTFIAEAVAIIFPFIPSIAYTFAIPVAAGAMIVRLFLNSETSLVFAAVVSILAGVLLDNSLLFSTYFFVGSVVAAGEVRYCMQRTTIIKAGLFVGFINMLLLLAFGLLMESPSLRNTLIGLPFGLIGGIITSVIVTGLTPILEVAFGYTTNIKLLELSRMDHPLLKALALQAPGTYHHSMVIGSLVESAAESINANPLLARVSAFYHDIGKMKKPQYFVENQMGRENKHERLNPSMSALILISHVKEGIELAKEYRLGEDITHAIREHHGNSLITYFYRKAKEMEDPEVHEVMEEDFRYPGQKPQTKEAGLVMLADAVEATCKSIPNPTPAKVKGTVQKIINKIFTDGQLDECELTLRDLNEIASSFNRVLNGIFHQRIVYPEPVHKTEGVRNGSDESFDKRRTEKNKNKRSRVSQIGPRSVSKIRVK